jgi:HK97 family phage major capsid protein
LINEKELNEKRNDLLEEMERSVNSCKHEKRNLSSKELKRIEDIRVEIHQIDEDLENESEQRSKLPMVNVTSTEITKEERQFIEHLRENRGLSAGANGAVIPVSIATKIIEKVKELSPVLSKSTIYTVKGDLSLPKYDYTTITSGYMAELVAPTATGGDFTGVTLKSVIVSALVIVSNSLINRSDVDAVQIIIKQLARSMADFLEKELLTGAGGVDKIQGSLATGITSSITGATTLTIIADELIDVQMGVKSVYQENAIWIMNPTTYKAIRKLKDSQNRYLIGNMENGDGFTLLGKPVYLSDNMPVNGVNNKCIYYGDMNGLVIKFAQDVQIKVLQERYADQYATGVIGFVELDAVVADVAALSVYVGK